MSVLINRSLLKHAQHPNFIREALKASSAGAPSWLRMHGSLFCRVSASGSYDGGFPSTRVGIDGVLPGQAQLRSALKPALALPSSHSPRRHS